MGFVLLTLSLAAQAVCAVALVRGYGIAAGLVLYAMLTLASSCIAGWLLRISTNGTVNWKNYIAGFLLPWSQFVGGGQLHTLLIKNALTSMVFGSIIVVGDQLSVLCMLRSPETSAISERTNWLILAIGWLTVGCWVVLLAAWLTMLRSFVKHQSNLISTLFSMRGFWMPLLVPPVAVGISVALKIYGQTWAALLFVGIPLLILLFPVILMLSMILYHYLIGKPIRWN